MKDIYLNGGFSRFIPIHLQNLDCEPKHRGRRRGRIATYRVFFYLCWRLIEPSAFIFHPILFIDTSFSLGDDTQSNEV